MHHCKPISFYVVLIRQIKQSYMFFLPLDNELVNQKIINTSRKLFVSKPIKTDVHFPHLNIISFYDE